MRMSLLSRNLGIIAVASWCGFNTPISAHGATPQNRSEAVSIIRDLRQIVAPDGIESLETIPINGIEQYVSVRSRNPDNPVLLVLHGGPGWVAMPTSWWFAQGWEEYFTVVQWDQRGAGKTYGANDPVTGMSSLSVAQMHSDAREVVRWARQRFKQDKIVLLGHSWGSILGLQLAKEHPEWFHAYVGVGQGVDGLESERRGWAWALERAQSEGRDEAIRDLQSIAPYASGPDAPPLQAVMLQRKWVNHYGGAAWRRPNASFEGNAIYLSPEYTDQDIKNVWKAQNQSSEIMLSSILQTNFNSMNKLETPIVLFLGRHDKNVSSEVASEWFQRIEAPCKKLVWFEQSAHEVLVEEPGKTLVSLVTDVLPIIGARGTCDEVAFSTKERLVHSQSND